MFRYILFFLAFMLFSCQEPYVPNYEIEDTKSIFIVEGYINLDGSSDFKLSKTVPIQSENTHAPVSEATFEIIGSQGYIFSQKLVNSEGNFQLNHGVLDSKQNYKVRIISMGQTYESAFVAPLLTSSVSKIDTSRTENGLEFKVSTNNILSENKFYRWEFDEDWRFSAKFLSFLIFDQNSVRLRESNEGISFCFQHQKSSNINIASTETYAQNRIENQIIHLIPNHSEKLQYRYSINVKQYNISKEAFMYWETLRKNSESVGDIFGSMPSQIKGNIKNVNQENEPVIGMIQAGKFSQKRIYLDNPSIKPVWISKIPFYDNCASYEVLVGDAPGFFPKNPQFIPIHDIYKNEASPYPTHYAYTSKICTDCSVRGKKQAPDFWTEQ